MKNPLPAPVVRVASALLVCAALFQSGRTVGRLEGRAEAPAARYDPGNELVAASYRVDPAPEPKPAVSAGDPVGESGDIITPLNVRDPSALVMGPSGHSCPLGSAEPPSLPEPKAHAAPYKGGEKVLPEGRLLELLEKQGELPEKSTPKKY